jgi:hypothetical protein
MDPSTDVESRVSPRAGWRRLALAVARVGAGVVSALALGLGSLYFAVRPGVARGEVTNGPWHTSLVVGSASADLYTRARVSLDLLLSLNTTEMLYFTAVSDSEGRPFDARCAYRIEGGELPARWWSVTSYGRNGFLIPNEAGLYSVSQSSIVRAVDGSWRAQLSCDRQPGNWLPAGRPSAAGPFTLTLRLFDPQPVAIESPSSIDLPRIVREACS